MKKMITFLHKLMLNGKKRIAKHSFQGLLSFSFAAVLIIGIGVVVFMIYLRYSAMFENAIEQNNIRMLDQTNQYLDTYLRNLMKVSDTAYYQVIKKKDLSEQKIEQDLNFIYNSNQEQIVSIALFNTFGEVIGATPLSTLKSNIDVKNYPGFQEATEEIENIYFSTPHVQNLFVDPDEGYKWVVSLTRNVKINQDKSNENGVLLVDVNFSGIEQVCRSASLGTDSYLYLVDQFGEIIYHPRQQLIYSQIEQENNKQAALYEDGIHRETLDKQERMVTVKSVGYTGWKLVAVTPITDLTHQYFQLQGFALFIFLIGVIGLMIVTKIVSTRLSNPILALENDMLQIAAGNLDLKIQVGGSSEIRHLEASINLMVDKMKNLIQNAIEEQEVKRKTELDALQTQINPHFLYNTLDSVIWMVENERYDGAITMITALAKLFRISLSQGRTIITMKEELQHAESYLTIQQIRYKNKFHYDINAEEDTLSCVTLKLIIQPMIENAITHGLEAMGEDDGGMINVNVYSQDDDLYIDIMDNGIGMTPKEMQQLFKVKVKKKGSGIGMMNVSERIRLYFHEPYGLEVFSEADEGTLIRIHLPKIEMSEMTNYE